MDSNLIPFVDDTPDTSVMSNNKPISIFNEHASTILNSIDDKFETPTVHLIIDKGNECKVTLNDPGESSKSHDGNLRRNSISMPNLGEIEDLRRQYVDHPCGKILEHHQSTGSGFSDGNDTIIDDSNEIISDDEKDKISARNARKKSGMVPSIRKSGDNDDDEYSPVNSVTSSNSLASLLKEKIQSLPSKIRKKPDYKIKAFVSLMFLAIVFFVGFAYVMYHQRIKAKSYFENVRFNKVKRIIRLFNSDDFEILRGDLGVNLGPSKAFPCISSERRDDGSYCLEWVGGARLYLSHIQQQTSTDNATCYYLHWHALSRDVFPTDCYELFEHKAHWYGGGKTTNLSWPLEKGTRDLSPFITGDMARNQWGNVVTRYFVNSKGIAIIIDEDTPLHISINRNSDNKLCLQGRYDDFAFINHHSRNPELKYKICTAQNMTTLHTSIHSEKNSGTPLWDGMKPDDMTTLDSLISEPVWQIAPRFKNELTEATVYNYTEDVIDLGFLKQGHVLINEFWQDQIGDFILDTTRFETLAQTVDILHRRGFKIVFSIQPFISTESKSFAELVQKRLLVTERNTDRRVPALTRYKSVPTAGILDITNNRTVPWILEKLEDIKSKYQIDSYFLDLGAANNMPFYYQCEQNLLNPDHYSKKFIETFEKTLSIIGVTTATSLPRPPIFVSLPPLESSWESIKTVIPTILTYGLIGYPFLMPGAVGGDIYWPGSEQFIPTYPKPYADVSQSNSTQENGIVLPEKELYMRWLQLATFLPVMKFTHLPSKYNDEEVLDLAKSLTGLRQKTVRPLLLKCKQQALEEGLPLIRPLWLISPGDAPSLAVSDEFAVGDKIIVAPILDKGKTFRDVYLPAGVWTDGIDGSLRKGNRWMHDYKVPVDKVAYFVKYDDRRVTN